MTFSKARRTSAAAPLLLTFLLCTSLRASLSCSVVAVGKGASADGSVMITHTDDMGLATNDLRLVRVPAATHEKGALRPVYKANDSESHEHP